MITDEATADRLRAAIIATNAAGLTGHEARRAHTDRSGYHACTLSSCVEIRELVAAVSTLLPLPEPARNPGTLVLVKPESGIRPCVYEYMPEREGYAGYEDEEPGGWVAPGTERRFPWTAIAQGAGAKAEVTVIWTPGAEEADRA